MKLTVVCSGDSVTAGINNKESYPGRLQDKDLQLEQLNSKVLELAAAIPGIEEVELNGFFATAAKLSENRVMLYFTATEYDAKINQAFEAIRNHRSRVNLFTQAPPCGQNGVLQIKLSNNWQLVKVTLPFEECTPEFDASGNIKLSRPAVSVMAELELKEA